MKFNYYPETDSLYIDFTGLASVESREISAGVVVDYDAKGAISGIDIDNASKVARLDNFEISGLVTAASVLQPRA